MSWSQWTCHEGTHHQTDGHGTTNDKAEGTLLISNKNSHQAEETQPNWDKTPRQ